MKTVAFFAAVFCLWASAAPVPTNSARDRYVAYGVKSAEVAAIFHSRTIERRLLFTIDVPPEIFHPVFSNLEYAVAMARAYAAKAYTISNSADGLKAWDGYRTWATIWPMKADPASGRFVYFIKGTYKGGLTVNGTMLMDLFYENRGGNTFFFITTYISIDDPFIREIAQFLTQFKSFKEYLDRLIEGTIGEIRRVGFVTARALVRYRSEHGGALPPWNRK